MRSAFKADFSLLLLQKHCWGYERRESRGSLFNMSFDPGCHGEVTGGQASDTEGCRRGGGRRDEE